MKFMIYLNKIKERKINMITSLTRINELAMKQRNLGLTVSELQEQAILRQQYLQEIRGQIQGTITNLKIVDQLGQDVTPNKLVQYKQQVRGIVS